VGEGGRGWGKALLAGVSGNSKKNLKILPSPSNLTYNNIVENISQKPMTLSELEPGKIALVKETEISRHGQKLVNRLEAMGIIPDKPVAVLRKAWLGGPLHIRIGSTTEIAIRRQEAQMILVQPLEA
jgi:ferrous iron transport protein A